MATITEYRHNPSKNAYGEWECDHGNAIPGVCDSCQYIDDAADDETVTVHQVEELLMELLDDPLADNILEDSRAVTFKDAGILTRDKGVVLRFTTGDEFQITIVQSR